MEHKTKQKCNTKTNNQSAFISFVNTSHNIFLSSIYIYTINKALRLVYFVKSDDGENNYSRQCHKYKKYNEIQLIVLDNHDSINVISTELHFR